MSKRFSNERVGRDYTRAAQEVHRGEVVAFPTETSYGLAADPFNAEAIEKVFAIKQRSLDKPLLLLVEDLQQLSTIVEEIPAIYGPLIKRFWPGPLTLIFPVKKHLIGSLTSEGSTIGIRITPHRTAQQFIKEVGQPITATSANLAGHEAAYSAKDVFDHLGQAIAYILEDDPLIARKYSTIVGSYGGKISVVREGAILSEDIFQK